MTVVDTDVVGIPVVNIAVVGTDVVGTDVVGIPVVNIAVVGTDVVGIPVVGITGRIGAHTMLLVFHAK